MSDSIRNRIIAYLGRGIQQSVVASSCGVTPGYVTQLLELPEVREQIALLRAKDLEEAIQVDSDIDRVEKAALQMVERRLPFVRNAVEAARVFQTLNSAKKKAVGTDQSSDALAAQQVTVTIPRGATIHFKMNEASQVIEVDGRAMAPLPSRVLPTLQAKLLSSKEPVTDLVPTIPATTQQFQPSPLQKPAKELTPEMVAHRQKQEQADVRRATGVLRDLTMYMEGVLVVL